MSATALSKPSVKKFPFCKTSLKKCQDCGRWTEESRMCVFCFCQCGAPLEDRIDLERKTCTEGQGNVDMRQIIIVCSLTPKDGKLIRGHYGNYGYTNLKDEFILWQYSKQRWFAYKKGKRVKWTDPSLDTSAETKAASSSKTGRSSKTQMRNTQVSGKGRRGSRESVIRQKRRSPSPGTKE